MADNELLQMTADITSAYLETNKVPAADIPGLVRAIHDALKGLSSADPAPAEAAAAAAPSTAQVRRSIKPDGLTSFVDGKTYKTLKRHLATHGLTPAEYRTRYGLPADYPMVSPNYSAARSELAKSLGLGSKGRQVTKTPARAKK